jgi:integrase
MSKQFDNQGSVYRRQSNGRWTVAIRDAEGNQKTFLPEENTKAAAFALLDLKKLRLRQNQPLKDSSETVGEWLDVWFDTYLKSTLRPNTRLFYEGFKENHLKPEFGDIELAKLTGRRIQQWVKRMLEGGTSATTGEEHKSLTTGKVYNAITVCHALKLLRRALRRAVIEHLIVSNPSEHIDMPDRVKYEAPIMNPKERGKFFAVADQTPYKLLFHCLDVLGLRRSEGLGLKWGDFDFEGTLQDGSHCATVHVQRSLHRFKVDPVTKESKLEFVPPKTLSGNRILPLGAELEREFRKHHALQARQQLSAGRRWQDHDLVFTTKNGTPYEPRNITRAFKQLLKAAGLSPKFRLHGLRHGTATEMLNNGVDLGLVSKFLGHSTIQVTSDLYAKAQVQGLSTAVLVTNARAAREAAL